MSNDDITQHPTVLMIERLANYLQPLLVDADDIVDVMRNMASYLDEAYRDGIEDCIAAIESAGPTKLAAMMAIRDLIKVSAAKQQKAGRA